MAVAYQRFTRLLSLILTVVLVRDGGGSVPELTRLLSLILTVVLARNRGGSVPELNPITESDFDSRSG